MICQQDGIYEAETELSWAKGCLLTREEAQNFYDSITESDAFHQHYEWWEERVFVLEDPPADCATAVATMFDGVPAVAVRDKVSELVLLHELAHLVIYPHEQVHGPNFVEHYLKLVYLFLGAREWVELKNAFERHGVYRKAEA